MYTCISGITCTIPGIQNTKRAEFSGGYMKSVLLASALLLSSFSFAQQQGQPPPNGPPQTTPPTFPRTERPQDRMPPDQQAQPLSTAQVQEQIQQGLNS